MGEPRACRRDGTVGVRCRWASLLAVCGVAACASLPARTAPEEPPRVAAARSRQAPALAGIFRADGAEYPAPLAIVAFKLERALEVRAWSRRSRRDVTAASFPILGASGSLGPKRRAWDHQVPEGFYRVTALNPASLYHLSLRIDYPNASDRALGDPGDPGGEIFIHGDAVSDGCIAIGDRAVERLFLAVLDSRKAGHEVPVAIFPCRFERRECREALRAEERRRPQLAAFWANLAAGYRALAASGAPPAVRVGRSGRYAFAAR